MKAGDNEKVGLWTRYRKMFARMPKVGGQIVLVHEQWTEILPIMQICGFSNLFFVISDILFFVNLISALCILKPERQID